MAPHTLEAEGLTKQAEKIADNISGKQQTQQKITALINQIFSDVTIGQNRDKLEVEIASRDPTGEYNITSEGFGLNQLVFLFYYLSTSERGSTILIEEPEISLHPQAQLVLSTILIDTSIKEEKQLVITTHSEHVVLGLLGSWKSRQIDENGRVEEGLKRFLRC